MSIRLAQGIRLARFSRSISQITGARTTVGQLDTNKSSGAQPGFLPLFTNSRYDKSPSGIRRPVEIIEAMVRPGSSTTFSTPGPLSVRRNLHVMPDKSNGKGESHDDGQGAVTTSLTHADSGKLATVTVSRPRKLNALNSHMLAALPATLQHLAESHPDLIGVILTGEGDKSFVGGADIAEMASLSAPADARAFISRVHAACKSLRDCPVPVICRVNGIALGAGLEIAASCDMRVASSTAVFGMPEVHMGLPSVVEAALLPGLIGWGRTRQLLLLGDTITAEEGLKWGLVEKVVEPGQLDEAVASWTRSLEKAGPASVRNQKALMSRWEELGLDAGIAASIDHFGQAFEKPSPSDGKGSGEAEPVRMMGEFLAKQAEKRKNKL